MCQKRNYSNQILLFHLLPYDFNLSKNLLIIYQDNLNNLNYHFKFPI